MKADGTRAGGERAPRERSTGGVVHAASAMTSTGTLALPAELLAGAGQLRPNPYVRNGLYNDHMSRIVTASEAKAKVLALLDEVAAGEEVQITKHGRLVARLVPAVGPHALRGALSGVAATAVEEEDELFSTDAVWTLD
jgi:prevent-host-death family protein